VVGCVTSEGLVVRGPGIPGEQQTAHFQDGFAILNRQNGDTLSLEVYHRFVVRQAVGQRARWTASTVEYVYEVSDQAGDLLAAWHWHPGDHREDHAAPWPHLHAYGERGALTLHKLHLPTGRVALEAVVRFLVNDLGVLPRRPDWRAALDRREEQFRRARSWA
jgi:hypothetical protein